jgi:SAM-dependent methyltransferase
VTARTERPSWSEYLECFHATEPGVTDDILQNATRQQVNPYQWLVEPLHEVTRLLDLACGNGPVHRLVRETAWIGADRSPAELGRARQDGARRMIRSEANALPFPSGVFDGFVCSMALMLLDPLETSLAELRRVLRPDATGVITIPGTWPLNPSDLWRYGRLMTSLRLTHLRYPNDRALLRLHRVLDRQGFNVISDQRRRFAYTISDDEAARRFVRSLYLPGVPEARIRHAERITAHRQGHRIGIPLRRVVVKAA